MRLTKFLALLAFTDVVRCMRQSLLFAAAVTLVACGADDKASSPEPVEPVTDAMYEDSKDSKDGGIEWFAGSVDDAFAVAAESGKPLYLYWGAVWCPPCHAISATIFNRPEFIERSKLFVPVYLDGDTENAQAYAEKFGVLGYPTMIVFDPNGTELTRIPGGIDLQAYANILDLTLNDASPASDIVASLLADEAPLSAAECGLLAYYSWGQDTRILADQDTGAAFRRMYTACPETMPVEKSILYMSWLDAVLEAEADSDDPVPMTPSMKAEALTQIQLVLADDDLTQANIFNVIFSGARYASALTDAGTEARNSLVDGFRGVLIRLAADESIYKRERIYTLVGRIRLERIDDAESELSAGLQQEIRDTVVWADTSTPSVYERQPIVNALGNVLNVAGMDDVAKPLLQAELEKSKQPYYFMVSLADIEQRAGNFDAAVNWLRQAHDVSQGPATRFQWGYYYVNGLLEMTPTATQLIHDTTVGLIEELQSSAGFYQRPKAQLSRLETKLSAWGTENDLQPELLRIRDSVLTVCANSTGSDSSREACESFLGQI
jgi:thioredoxin-related protein